MGGRQRQQETTTKPPPVIVFLEFSAVLPGLRPLLCTLYSDIHKKPLLFFFLRCAVFLTKAGEGAGEEGEAALPSHQELNRLARENASLREALTALATKRGDGGIHIVLLVVAVVVAFAVDVFVVFVVFLFWGGGAATYLRGSAGSLL